MTKLLNSKITKMKMKAENIKVKANYSNVNNPKITQL